MQRTLIFLCAAALAAASAAAQEAPSVVAEGPFASSDANDDQGLLTGLRFTLTQEVAGRFRRPHTLSNNRTSLRAEYERHFLDNFYVRADVIETAFWRQDHRAESRGASLVTENTVRQALLQFSKGNTSIKLGRQILIWGESDAGAITDVIAPRNLSELMFISLENARLSQLMLTVDQFTSVGDWGLFYIPRAKFNRYPERGDTYDVDPFQGNAVIANTDKRLPEYGLRWKKTFGRSDVSLMAARLVDNDPALRQDGTTADGRMLIRREPQRFNMLGATFNLAGDSFLLTGEMARKAPVAFLNASTLQPVKKNVIDTSLRLEYSLGNGGNHSVSLEAVNRHVLGWSPSIEPTPKNTNTLVLGWHNTFLNETLSADWLTVVNTTRTGLTHSLFLSYRLNDKVTLGLDAFYLNVKDRNNDLYPYRGQNSVVLRLSYQF